MAYQYFPLFIMLALAAFIGIFVVVLGHSFGPRRPSERKGRPYESGMVPYGAGTRRVSVRYYLVGVLFILFDIEVVFLLPWAVAARTLGVPGLVLMGIFLVVLEIAFVYAWKKGAMEWE